MSLPRSIYPAPFNSTRASHVVLGVNDLGASRAFYVDALGLVVSDEEADTLYLRGVEEACHHSLVLKRTKEAPACERLGMRVFAEEDLDKAEHHFERAGLPATWVEVPYQGRTLQVSDPTGTPLEFCATMPTKPRLVVEFRRHRGAVPQRIDHYQIAVPDVGRACAFYCDLGFRISEYVAIDGTDDLVFVFLQRKGNPHDIVFAAGPGPRLHHFAFSTPDTAHVVHACDVLGNCGFGPNLEFGPGRHGPGHALFAYFRDPDGHRVEIFNTHYQTMDIENEPVRWDASYLRQRPWGLPPRRKWYQEASVFSQVPVQEPAVAPKPATLEAYLAEEGA